MGDALLRTQGVERVASLHPAKKGGVQRGESAGGCVHFPHVEFGGVEAAFDEVGTEVFARELFQSFENQGENLFRVFGFHAAQAGAEAGLPQVEADVTEHVFAEVAFEQGQAQRTGRTLQQQLGDEGRGLPRQGVGAKAGEQPVELTENTFIAFFGGGVKLLHAAGMAPAGLQLRQRGGLAGRDPRKDFVELFQTLERIIVAVESDKGIGGVVVCAMEGDKAVVVQIGNVGGTAAVVEAVKGVGIEAVLLQFLQPGVGTGVNALHFVVDHALDFQFALAVPLGAPAFLTEHFGSQAGEKHRVEINVHEVVVVAQVAAGHGVAGAVGVGVGVEVGLERGLDQLFERLFNGVFLAAAEHAVFEDVGKTRVIVGEGGEKNAEGFVVVRAGNRQHAGAAAVKIERAGGVPKGKKLGFEEGVGGMGGGRGSHASSLS